ncbi:MAG TPA: hypothetical protein VFZ76_19390 [Anaerolineales bacterium]
MKSRYLGVMRKMLPHLRDADILWVLTGSLAFALQGIPLEVHDIDIQSDEDGAYEIARLFPQHLIKPVTFSSTDIIRSHFGRLLIDDIKVEIMGNLQKRLRDGTWEPAPDLYTLRGYIDFDDLKIPVFPLEYEHKAYLMLGRPQTAMLLRDWLDDHPQKT